ncbi:MAG: GIY-YIG nuclease family protein [Opitutaceae bacterium]|nr:GIY-YIG nuclease family protein [Opitutaceae bacterium]
MSDNPLIQTARQLAPNIGAGTPAVYFLRLRSGVIYVGASTNLEQRLGDHVSGQACRTTALDPPTAILRVEPFASFPHARRREIQLKRWSHAKKEALIRGELESLKRLSRSRS